MRLMRWQLVGIAALILVDAAITAYAVTHHITGVPYEANPLMRRALMHPWTFWASKAVAIGTLTCAYFFVQRRMTYQLTVYIAFWVILALFASVVAVNIWMWNH